MTATPQAVKALQARFIALGFQLPHYGADGDFGSESISAAHKALDELVTRRGLAGALTPDLVPAASVAAAKVTSPAGRKKISDREGNILKAYYDGGGVLTIGVGHTSAAGAPKVIEGMKITAAESDEILSRDLKAVEKQVTDAVKVKLNQNQFDALVSLVFNIGPTAFGKSTLLKNLNAGNYQAAADQFLVWNKDNGKVVDGLVSRRKSERQQFLTA